MKLGEVNAVGLAVGPPELEQMRSESCRSGSRPVKKHAGDYLGGWMLELAKATVKNLSSSELLGPRERRRARIAIGLGWSRRRSGPLVHAAAPTGSNDRSGGDDGLGQISIASRDRNRVSTNRSPDSRNGARQCRQPGPGGAKIPCSPREHDRTVQVAYRLGRGGPTENSCCSHAICQR